MEKYVQEDQLRWPSSTSSSTTSCPLTCAATSSTSLASSTAATSSSFSRAWRSISIRACSFMSFARAVDKLPWLDMRPSVLNETTKSATGAAKAMLCVCGGVSGNRANDYFLLTTRMTVRSWSNSPLKHLSTIHFAVCTSSAARTCIAYKQLVLCEKLLKRYAHHPVIESLLANRRHGPK